MRATFSLFQRSVEFSALLKSLEPYGSGWMLDFRPEGNLHPAEQREGAPGGFFWGRSGGLMGVNLHDSAPNGSAGHKMTALGRGTERDAYAVEAARRIKHHDGTAEMLEKFALPQGQRGWRSVKVQTHSEPPAGTTVGEIGRSPIAHSSRVFPFGAMRYSAVSMAPDEDSTKCP